MSDQSIAKILQDLNNAHYDRGEKTASDESEASSSEKVASANGDDSTKQAQQSLSDSLNSLVGDAEGQTKQAANDNGAGNADALSHLEKMANDMAEVDYQATIKEAHAFGAAVFQGFLASANEYSQNTKTASQDPTPQTDDRAIKTAAQWGYESTENLLSQFAGQQRTKTAAEEEAEGAIEALEKVAALAEDCFVRGVEHMASLTNDQG